jgi:hypothetical protein
VLASRIQHRIRYADAGKTCKGGEDCLGPCLSDAPDDWTADPAGTPVAGKCEAEKNTFGYFGVVESGKLTEGYLCVD